MICRPMGALAIALAIASPHATALTTAQAETLVAEVRAQGMLTPVVRVRAPTESEQEVGLATKIENDFSCALIVAQLPGDSLVPIARRDDPLVQEFMLLHELAHCEHMSLPTVFSSRQLPPRLNRAYHDLVLLAPWAEAVALFKEMFADTYAGTMLLARHHDSREALALIGDFARWRRARALVIFPSARIHATAPALEALLEGGPVPQSPAPSALRGYALETASDAFLASLPQHTFSDQIALNDSGTLDSARYVGWMWRAAEGTSAVRTFEHHQRIAARLAHPMPDLLARMRTFVKRNPTPEAMRAFFDELQGLVHSRLHAGVQQASLARRVRR